MSESISLSSSQHNYHIESSENQLVLYKEINPLVNSEMMIEIAKYAELPTLADVKVMHFISVTQIPAYYEPKIRAIVPKPTLRAYNLVKWAWQALRNPLRERVGTFPELEQHVLMVQQHSENNDIIIEQYHSENSATTTDELYFDELEGAEIFLPICQQVAQSGGGTAHFGPGNVNIVKSKDSILSKVQRTHSESGASVAHAIAQIDDGVRGTISYDTPEQLRSGMKEFLRLADQNGWEVDVSNLWENEEDYGGYIDFDVRIMIPLSGNRHVVAELQFHLNDFYDGTKDSPVSRAHKVYEEMRMIPVTGKSNVNLSYTELNEASRLYFTTALFQAFRKG